MDGFEMPEQTAPEDDRLLMVRRLIEVERDLESAEYEAKNLDDKRDKIQAHIEKARANRREITDELAARLGVLDAPMKAMKAPSLKTDW